MMKVLLCTPYDSSLDAGGIPMWAKAVIAQYETNDLGVQLDVFPMDRSASSYRKVETIHRLYFGIKDYGRICNELKARINHSNYDVIHICSSASVSLLKDVLMLRFAKKKHCKTIIHFHFGRIPELSVCKNWEWKLLKQVVNMADKVVTMDMNSYETLISTGFLNVENIPNPLSTAIKNKVEDIRGHAERVPNTVLYVGHVIPTKGVYELVQAVNAIPDLNLRIVGKYSESVKKDLSGLAMRDNGNWLKFVGVIPHEEVIKEMLTCDIFTLPSYTEGFPNVILESMACGCTIIATPVGAIPEMLDVDGSRCGIVVNPRQADELQKAFEDLESNTPLKIKLARNAEKRVSEMYSAPAVWSRLVTLWKSI